MVGASGNAVDEDDMNNLLLLFRYRTKGIGEGAIAFHPVEPIAVVAGTVLEKALTCFGREVHPMYKKMTSRDENCIIKYYLE